MSAWVTLSSLPELRRLDPVQKRGVVHQALRHPNMILLALAMILGLGVGVVATAIMLHLLRKSFGPAGVAIGGGGMALILCALFHQFFARMSRHGVRAIIKQHLRAGRFQVCLHCGYDQRGHQRDTCPECGASILIQPRAGSISPSSSRRCAA